MTATDDRGLAALAAALDRDWTPFWDETQPAPFVHESTFNRERFAAALLGDCGVFWPDGAPEVALMPDPLSSGHPYTCHACHGQWWDSQRYLDHLPTCPRDKP
jgi:hypothetical protein